MSTPRTDAVKIVCGFQAVPEPMLKHAQELERENAALKQRIIDDNRAYGCELRDPSGTIWDHAKRLQDENAALRADKERLDWLDQKIVSSWLDGEDFVVWDKSSPQPCSIREWLDSARKEAQP